MDRRPYFTPSIKFDGVRGAGARRHEHGSSSRCHCLFRLHANKNPIFHFVHMLNRAFGDIICIRSTVSSFGMQSILRSSLRRITWCCSSASSTLNHGGGGMSSSSSIKFRSVRSSFPAAAAMGDANQSVEPAFTSSQTRSFSTAPDLNGNNMIDHHDAQSPPENQKWYVRILIWMDVFSHVRFSISIRTCNFLWLALLVLLSSLLFD